MDNYKKTDDIIDALEQEIDVANYTKSKYADRVSIEVLKDAINLTNNQKEEIKRLREENSKVTEVKVAGADEVHSNIIKQNRDNFWILKWLDEFMVGHKGFICGGCFKNIFNKEKVKDIDIFFRDISDFEEAVAYFDKQTVGYERDDKGSEKYRFYYENKNVKAYKHIDKDINIELCCKVFGTPEEILSKFDFTITKFAYYKEEVKGEPDEDGNSEVHTEYKVMYNDKFFEHLHLKRVVTDNEILFPMSTFDRMLRYARYGYFPCRETKLKIIKSLRGLSDEQVELPESFYDGMD